MRNFMAKHIAIYTEEILAAFAFIATGFGRTLCPCSACDYAMAIGAVCSRVHLLRDGGKWCQTSVALYALLLFGSDPAYLDPVTEGKEMMV